MGAGPGGGVVYGCCGGPVAGDEEDVLSGWEGLLDGECGREAEDAGAVIVSGGRCGLVSGTHPITTMVSFSDMVEVYWSMKSWKRMRGNDKSPQPDLNCRFSVTHSWSRR